MKHNYDIIIIGGGAVGCAIAYALSRFDLHVALLERNTDVAMGTSGKNSAVIHAGFNNPPGSLMAELCVQGNKNFEQLCKTLSIPYSKTGKLVVALDESDITIIDNILRDGEKNGCVGLSKIDKNQLAELEPNAVGVAALFSANTAVINPFLYTIHLAETALRNGVDFYLNSEVTEIHNNGSFNIVTAKDTFNCDIIINSAGLYSDKIAALAGDTSHKIYPNRGEYLILDKEAANIVKRPIYPVPRKGVGGLGVHLTTTIDGNMLIGPSAEFVASPEEYSSTAAMTDKLFTEAQLLLPQLKRNMLIGQYTGIRAKTVPPGGANFGDFIIEQSKVAPNLINLIGIESPGLTASMPIAERVVAMLKTEHNFNEKQTWDGTHTANPVFRTLNSGEQNSLIRNNPDYGEIICRCETITKAEVLNALNNPLGVRTLTGIKNRTRTMTGRCQSGYCLSNIADILTKELHIEPQNIVYKNRGDKPFQGRVK
jgi:glycerol-3-phosphate dehydrogenase